MTGPAVSPHGLGVPGAAQVRSGRWEFGYQRFLPDGTPARYADADIVAPRASRELAERDVARITGDARIMRRWVSEWEPVPDLFESS